MTNQEMMEYERRLLRNNDSFKALDYRNANPLYRENKPLETIPGIPEAARMLKLHGGYFQQNRMIKDKRKSLEKALLYSYQSAFVKKYTNNSDQEAKKVRALINPNKLKPDYDDKIISIGFEEGFEPGDIFEWVDTNTYWIIYLQQQSEAAYFRGDIRKCSFQISWKDGDQVNTTFAAIRGPVETKINYIQKHGVSMDTPNYSLHILMPKNENTLKYFKRYAKFYLQNIDTPDPVCWRVEAVDSISMPGIIEINAIEYYINEHADDVENGVVDGLIMKPIEPNSPEVEEAIVGETFIKPYKTYEYEFNGALIADWGVDREDLPLEYEIEGYYIKLKWTQSYSGQFVLSYGDYYKTIVVESLF